MTVKFNSVVAAIVAVACVLSADAQNLKHNTSNRKFYPNKGISSGLGGSSVGLQRAVIAQPTMVKKTVAGEGSYKEVQPPTDVEIKAKEKKAAGEKIVDSIKYPVVVKFTPEQFKEHAVELVRDMYVTDDSGENLSVGCDLQEANGEIIKTKKFFIHGNKAVPKKEMLLKAFETGESFIVLRKAPVEVPCGLCDGRGTMKTGEIISTDKPPVSCYSGCTRCNGSKRSSIEVDMVYKVLLKDAE